MYEPRKSEWNMEKRNMPGWDRDTPFEELRDLYKDLEEAKAGFNPRDTPYIVGYTRTKDPPAQGNGPMQYGTLGTPVYKVRRVTQHRNLLRDELATNPSNSRREAINKEQKDLDVWEQAIIEHYQLIEQLGHEISRNEYVKRFYPNNINTTVYLKEGRAKNSRNVDDYLDITDTDFPQQFNINRTSHSTEVHSWDIANAYDQLVDMQGNK